MDEPKKIKQIKLINSVSFKQAEIQANNFTLDLDPEDIIDIKISGQGAEDWSQNTRITIMIIYYKRPKLNYN